MAIHKKLQEGAIFLRYHDFFYSESGHQRESGMYYHQFRFAYVHNRRERVSGLVINKKQEPFFEKLGFRINHSRHMLVAVGCRSYEYFSAVSDSPYPDPYMKQEAEEKLQQLLQSGFTTQAGKPFTDMGDLQEFQQKKMTNLDNLFKVSPEFRHHYARETYMAQPN